jgi:hypothetical protein
MAFGGTVGLIFRVEELSEIKNEHETRYQAELSLYSTLKMEGNIPPKRGLKFDAMHCIMSQKI